MFVGKVFVGVRDDASFGCPHAVRRSASLMFVPCDRGDVQLVIPAA